MAWRNTTGGAKAAADHAPLRLGRAGALAVGVLIGLTTVLVDGRLGRGPAGAGGLAAREDADSPIRLSRQSWRAVLKRTLREFTEDRVPAVAAGATFYSLLALFPALGVFVSLYGLFADLGEARRQISALRGVLPEGGITVLNEQITRLSAAPHGTLGLTFVLSLVLSVWSANAGMKALFAGLNIAYEEEEKRGFVALNLQSLAFTAGSILVAVAIMALAGAGPALAHAVGLGGGLFGLLRWPLLLVLTGLLLSVVYRYAPSREHARWQWITPGSAVATVGWLLMSVGFSLYVANFGRYDRTYGSLGAVVGFMTWIWLSLVVVLAGAELNSELEQQTSLDTTTGAPRPAGLRGASVADGRRRKEGNG